MKRGQEVERPSADLTRLNAAEVQVLQLLADGHTAKSIANLTGRSVLSVNERLRQARRKTGVSSSRELARMIKTQKNGHDQIGLVPAAQLAPSTRSRFRPGVIVMGTLLLAVAAIAVVATQAPNTTQPSSMPDDPVLNGVMVPPDLDARYLARLIRTEQRDPAWAEPLEAALRDRFSSLVAGGHVQLIEVSCAKTVCEVVGTIKGTDVKRRNKTMMDLQHAKLNAIAEGKATNVAIAFGPERFASYWTRS